MEIRREVLSYAFREAGVIPLGDNGANPELIVNGDFSAWSAVGTPLDEPTGWTVNPIPNTANNHVTEAIADGTPTDGGCHCKLVSDGNPVQIFQNVLIIGKTYAFSVTVTDVTFRRILNTAFGCHNLYN